MWPHKQAGHMTCTRPQAESQKNPLTRGRRPHMTHLGNGLCIAAIEIMLIFAEGSAGLMRVNQKPINCHKCC